MLPILDSFKEKYQLNQLIIIADSGLLSNTNIKELQSRNYEFILGARIKNEKQDMQRKVLSLKLANGDSEVIERDNLRLIVSYSDSKAKKDQLNREKGIRKLEKRIKSGKLNKSSINNKGYNKSLKLEGNVKITIDYQKFETDNAWDGLKGYLTNAKLPKDKIIENYGHLWLIEKAFRISKSDLKIRPVFHWARRRIESHICISFVSYKVYKELERQLKEKKTSLSPEKAIEIAKTIYQVKANTKNGEVKHMLLLSEEQKELARLFNFG